MVSFRSITLYLRERVIFSLVIATTIFLLLGLFLVVIRVLGLSDLLVLHVNIYNGIDWLGPWYWLVINYLLVLLFVVGNFFWSLYVYTRDKYMSYYLNVASLFAAIAFTFYLYITASYS